MIPWQTRLDFALEWYTWGVRYRFSRFLRRLRAGWRRWLA